MQQTQEQTLTFDNTFSAIDLVDLNDRQKEEAKDIWCKAILSDDKSPKKRVEYYIKVCLFYKAFPSIIKLNIAITQKEMALSLWCNADKNENRTRIVQTYLAQCQGIRRITKEPINQANILAKVPTSEKEALTIPEISVLTGLSTAVCQDTLRYLVMNKQANKVISRPRPEGGYYPARFWRSENIQFEDVLAIKEQEILEYIKDVSPNKDQLFVRYKGILSEQLVRQIYQKLHSERKIGCRWNAQKQYYAWVYGEPDLSQHQYYENIVFGILQRYNQITETSLGNFIGKNRTVAGKILRKMRDEKKLKVREIGKQRIYELITQK